MKFKGSVALVLGASMILGGCSGGGAATPATPQSVRPQVCLQAVALDVHAQDCGGYTGGGSTGNTFDVAPVTQNGYTSYGTGNWDTYAATGYAKNGAGAITGTSSGSTSKVIGSGTETWVAHVASISSNAITITAENGQFLRDGTNDLPGGIVLKKNATATGGSIATFTDARGRSWRMAGELNSDGHNVDVTFTVSGIGTWTQKFDARAFAPTELAAATAAARAGDLKGMVTAGDVAAVAGVVAGVAAGVAGIAACVPGGQTVALAAGAVSGIASAVAGVAAAIDHFDTKKT